MNSKQFPSFKTNETGIVLTAVQNDYVYYPSYGIYYSGSRHQYAYIERGAWVSQPAPEFSRLAGQSPRRRYPAVSENWKPTSSNQKRDNHDEHNGR